MLSFLVLFYFLKMVGCLGGGIFLHCLAGDFVDWL